MDKAKGHRGRGSYLGTNPSETPSQALALSRRLKLFNTDTVKVSAFTGVSIRDRLEIIYDLQRGKFVSWVFWSGAENMKIPALEQSKWLQVLSVKSNLLRREAAGRLTLTLFWVHSGIVPSPAATTWGRNACTGRSAYTNLDFSLHTSVWWLLIDISFEMLYWTLGLSAGWNQ